MGSYAPPLRRTDSFGLEFNVYPHMHSVSKILFESMAIAIDTIAGIQTLSRNRVIVKMRVHDDFEKLMRKYEDETVVLGALSAKVVNLSVSYTYVSVRNAPFELEDGTIQNFLSRYGKVDSMRNNKYANGPFEGLLNGVRTVKMKIRENIPSSCTIQGHNISFMYNGQVRTCFKCGLIGHMVKDCDVDISERVNIFDEDDFPKMFPNQKEKQSSSTKEKSDENDIVIVDKVYSQESNTSSQDSLQYCQKEDDEREESRDGLPVVIESGEEEKEITK